MSGEIIVKDVPVKLSLEKTIITETLDFDGLRFARKGVFRLIALILPIAFVGVLAIIALAVGYFAGEFGIEFTFWLAFFVVSYYSLLLLRKLMVNAAKEAHRVTKITKEEHLKIMNIMFGPFALIMIVIIAVVICVYDFNAYGLNVANLYDGSVEGWLQSVAEEPMILGNYYFPSPPMNGVWLIIWMACDLLSAAYCWYAIGFLLYSRKITKKYTFRNEASVVKQLNLTELELKAFIAVSYGFVPFLMLKSIAQIDFGGGGTPVMLMVPWWSDTIITAVTVLLFVLLLLLPSKQIITDVKAETVSDEFDAKARSILALTDIIQKIDKGEDLSLKNAVMALLYSSYLDQVKSFKASGSGAQKKILTSLMGPGVSYGAKMVTGSGAI